MSNPIHRNAIRHNIRVTTQPNNFRTSVLLYALGCAAVLAVLFYIILS